MARLQVKNLAKSYKAETVVVDVSLMVESGEAVGLLGPNGAGKTTTFYMVLGIVDPDAGHIFLDEQDISALPLHARAKLGIGYLPQEGSIFRRLTIFDNLMAVLELRSELSKQRRFYLAEALIGEFQLDRIRNHMGFSLSGGERRRVEIARALAANPKFILLDEPFAGVDPLSIIDIRTIIRSLQARGVGVLITDHNVRETLKVCDRAYVVNRGQICAHGTPEDILQHEVVKEVYLGEQFYI